MLFPGRLRLAAAIRQSTRDLKGAKTDFDAHKILMRRLLDREARLMSKMDDMNAKTGAWHDSMTKLDDVIRALADVVKKLLDKQAAPDPDAEAALAAAMTAWDAAKVRVDEAKAKLDEVVATAVASGGPSA